MEKQIDCETGFMAAGTPHAKVTRFPDDVAEEIIEESFDHFMNLLHNKALPELCDLIGKMLKVRPSRQLQLANMDVLSLRDHFQDLVDNGAQPPAREIPIEASEVNEPNPFTGNGEPNMPSVDESAAEEEASRITDELNKENAAFMVDHQIELD